MNNIIYFNNNNNNQEYCFPKEHLNVRSKLEVDSVADEDSMLV